MATTAQSRLDARAKPGESVLSRELILYADESLKRGRYYSHFYGGALVRSADFDSLHNAIGKRMLELGITSEVKWSKVNPMRLEPYKELMDTFFDLLEAGRIKARVMFTHNVLVPKELTRYHYNHTYQILYYQFIKHAFGLRYAGDGTATARIRIYLDRLPDTKEKNRQFKGYIGSLEDWPPFKRAGIKVPQDQIAEVDSAAHPILQCVDVVTGAMQFRLNDKHKEKPKGKARRAQKTLAKEKLYKHINQRIRQIRKGFNIGISTGFDGDRSNSWRHSYRHWCFKPSNVEFDFSRTK